MNTKRKERLNLIGKTFNRLSVIRFSHYDKKAHPFWLCKCICGKETLADESALLKGRRKSCGCYKIINLSGKKFGRLVVSEVYEKRNGKYYWLCNCDCGNEVYKNGESLRKGNTLSCGCYLIESRKVDQSSDRTDVMLNGLYRKLLFRHKKTFKNETPIDYKTYKDLIFSECFYCGSSGLSIIRDIRKEKKGRVFITENVLTINGIDRANNNIGYTISNSLPCCKNCNRAKSVLSLKDFGELIKKIYQHWAVKQQSLIV